MTASYILYALGIIILNFLWIWLWSYLIGQEKRDAKALEEALVRQEATVRVFSSNQKWKITPEHREDFNLER